MSTTIATTDTPEGDTPEAVESDTPKVWDTSDGTKVDGPALTAASANLALAMEAGASAVQRVSTLVHLICHWTIAARLAITQENGTPDFKGVSAAAKEAVSAVQDAAYESMSAEDASMLRNRVRSVLPVHLDAAIGEWTLANREGMPEASTLKFDGDGADVDLEAGDRPRRVIDAPAKLRQAVAKVYKLNDLTPQKGRWGQDKKAATNAKDTQDKVESAPLVIASASETVRTSGTTLESASMSVWDLADSILDATFAANGTESTETRETKDAASVVLLRASLLLKVASARLTVEGATARNEADAAKVRYVREGAPVEGATPTETVEVPTA